MKKAVILIVILILVVLGLGGYIAYDKLYVEKSSNSVITQLGERDIDLNVFKKIDDTIYKLDQTFNDSNTSYFGYLFNQKELKVTKFDQKAAILMSMYNYINYSEEEQIIHNGVVKREFKNIFDNNLTYKEQDVEAGDKLDIKYNPTTNVYTYKYSAKKDIYAPTYIEKNVSTTLETESIVVKRKIFYVEYEKNDTTTTAYIYQTKDKNKLIAKMDLKDNVINPDEVVGKYGYKLLSYKYIFEEKTVNEYLLKTIVRDK